MQWMPHVIQHHRKTEMSPKVQTYASLRRGAWSGRANQWLDSIWRHGGDKVLVVRLQLLWITGSTILQVRPRDEMMTWLQPHWVAGSAALHPRCLEAGNNERASRLRGQKHQCPGRRQEEREHHGRSLRSLALQEQTMDQLALERPVPPLTVSFIKTDKSS